MAPQRYTQFCPLARAAEILGERWTLLVVRELLLGPRRFSDFAGPLPGISPSVLASRLGSLERHGLVERRSLPPPAPASVYALTPLGEGLRPVVIELGRWGAQLLGQPAPGEHFEPAWVELGLEMCCRRSATPERRFRVSVPTGAHELEFDVRGGPEGTRVARGSAEFEVALRAEALVVMGLATGELGVDAALDSGALRASGDLAALADFPALFEKPEPPPRGE